MRNKNEGIYINLSIVFIPLLVILIPPDFLLSTSTLNTLNSMAVMILFFVLILLTFIKSRFNIFIVLSIFMFFWLSFSSYFLADGLLDISNNLRIISLLLFINLTIQNYPKSTLNALSYLFGTYIIINFITIILFKEGLYIDNPRTGHYRNAWFLGIENQFAFYLIPGITLLIFKSLYVRKKVSFIVWFIVLIAGITIFNAWSATAILGYMFIIISIILIINKKLLFLFNFKFMFLSYIIIWMTIVYLNSFAFFRGIITKLLKKDMTFSGRTNIWEKVIETIPESLWYGFGNNTYVIPNRVTEFRSHNMILQLILDNGIIGLLLFLICLIIVGLQFKKYKSDKISLVLIAGIFSILLGGIAESYKLNYLFLLLLVSYNYSVSYKQSDIEGANN